MPHNKMTRDRCIRMIAPCSSVSVAAIRPGCYGPRPPIFLAAGPGWQAGRPGAGRWGRGGRGGGRRGRAVGRLPTALRDRKSTRLNSSHVKISYAVFCLKKKKKQDDVIGDTN